MIKSFKHQSEYYGHPKCDALCRLFEVEVEILAHAEDEADYEIESISCTVTGETFELSSFPEGEVKEIEARAEKLCDEHAHDAWLSACEARADALYEAWKENGGEL